MSDSVVPPAPAAPATGVELMMKLAASGQWEVVETPETSSKLGRSIRAAA